MQTGSEEVKLVAVIKPWLFCVVNRTEIVVKLSKTHTNTHNTFMNSEFDLRNIIIKLF